MGMSMQTKEASVKTLRENFDKAISAVFVDFGGVNVANITDLRSRFRDAGVLYKVVKNNLVRKAVADQSFGEEELFQTSLRGMTAVAWSFEDPSAAAKIVKSFRKEGPEKEKLNVKCGLLEGKVLSAAQVANELATLPGRDELRAQLLAQLMAPAQTLVRQLHAPGTNFALVLDAYKRKQEQG